MDDNELLLLDRIAVIKQIQDLNEKGYLSFSGGKDSTVLHYLLDLALPNNTILRVYFDTGIEYKQCEIIWKPVYDEYRRIGYRLKKE